MSKSLYESLGGSVGIAAIVDDVVEEHMKNPAISARFLPYKDEPERLAALKKHTVDFFSAGSGGPVVYKGRDMPTAHKGMNITPAEYQHTVDDIMKVLGEHNIDEQSKVNVLAILSSLKDSIVAK